MRKKLVVLSTLALLNSGCDGDKEITTAQSELTTSTNHVAVSVVEYPVGKTAAENSSTAVKRMSSVIYESFEAGGWNAINKRYSKHRPGLNPELPKNFLFSQLQGPHSFALEKEIVRFGNYSAKLHWKHGKPEKWNDDPVVLNNTDRKAMFHGHKASSNQMTAWYGFSVYFPKEEAQINGKQAAQFFQLHGARDGNNEPTRIPVFSLHLVENGFHLGYAWDAAKVSTSRRGEGEGRIHLPVELTDYQDRWVDFVLQVRTNPFEEKGFFKLWIDGKAMVKRSNIKLGYNDSQGIYPSWGWLLWSEHVYRNQDLTLYLDELRQVESEEAGYFDVAPGAY